MLIMQINPLNVNLKYLLSIHNDELTLYMASVLATLDAAVLSRMVTTVTATLTLIACTMSMPRKSRMVIT